MLKTIEIVLSIALLLLNFFGGVASVVWLATLGEWSILGIGVAAIIVGVFLCRWVVTLGIILFILPSALLLSKYMGLFTRLVGYLFAALGQIWIYSIMFAWGAISYGLLIEGSSVETLVPSTLLAYVVTVTPWQALAKNDKSLGTVMAVFSLQVSAGVSLVLIMLDANFLVITSIFSGILFVAVFLNFLFFVMITNQVEERGSEETL